MVNPYRFLTEAERARIPELKLSIGESANWKEKLEARAGIEPANKGFADLCLTTWLPRLGGEHFLT